MSIVINDLNNTDNNEINISDLSSNEIDKIFVNDIVNIPLVKGETGGKGEKGDSNTLTIGTVEKGEEASATITGEAPNQVLNLVLPKGDQGQKGNTGDTGPAGESYDDTEIKAEIQDTNNKIENLSNTYKNSTIVGQTCEGFGKIHKLYGKTEETGEGEKSPSNPYEISCVADNINLFDKDKLQIASTWQCNCTVDSNKKISIKPTVASGVAFAKTNALYLKAGTYAFSSKTKGQLSRIRMLNNSDVELAVSETNNFTFTLETDTTINILFYVNNIALTNYLNIENIQIEKGSQATEYREYGEGSIKITSTDGTNTSNKVISCKPLCCLKDSEENIVAQDYIDFDRQKIHRECNKVNLNDLTIYYSTVLGDYFDVQFTTENYKSGFIKCSCLKTNMNAGNAWEAQEESISFGGDGGVCLNVKILKSRLSSPDITGFKNWLASNNIIVVYQLSQSIEEDIDITNSIVQYENKTTISNSDNAEMEIELTNNKAISSINKNIAELQEKDKEFIKKENILLKECKLLGTANNTDTTITLSDDKLSNYKFIAVSSGYFSNKSTTLIPVILFKILDGFNVCRQYVKTYNGYGWTSVQYINDTSFKIYGAVKEMANGSVGTDTITQVYGIK